MSFKSSFSNRDSRRKGVALIIVLAILILVTALVVGFLVRTGSERTAAASYRATARTRQLADTVVNLVQAQINQGTTTVTSGSTYAWASQPGAIRVFDNAGDQTIYKLYSSGTMVTTNYSSIAGDMPFSTGSSVWMSSPSLWVDLNAPAAFTISGAPALAYPIIDPRNPAGGDFTSGTGGADTGMAGFQVNPALIGGAASATNPIAPMPAQWLYVLQDGTIVPPNLTQSTGTSVVLSATNVSASNPIVGRVAFWTDDDTCRLNINTAGDGTFWDTPHFTAPDEWIMAYYSPGEYEYQRYPGHPATTSLLGVLSAVTAGANPNPFPTNTYTPTYSISLPASGGCFSYPPTNLPYQTLAYQTLFGGTNSLGTFIPGLLPQYAYGGSQEATVPENVTYNLTQYNQGFAVTSTICPLNNQRLYSSVGELLYSASNNGASPPARSYNVTYGTAAQALNRPELEAAKFFLTAHSRAPELTLFGTPRVSMWPLTTGSTITPGNGAASVSVTGAQVVPVSIRNTATDQLLAFAATINENGTASVTGTSVYPFYFMRNSNVDPSTDITLLRNGAAQNQQVLDYLDSMMSMPVPGFSSASFYSKYLQTGCRQILTEIFDYVRATDTEDGVVIANVSNGIDYIYGQTAFDSPNWAGSGIGNVVPTLNPMWPVVTTSGTVSLEGFGTFPRPTCVTIHFIALGNGVLSGTNGQTVAGGASVDIPAAQMQHFANVPNYGVDYDQSNIIVDSTTGVGHVAAGRVAIQAFVYVQFVNPAAGRRNTEPPSFWITLNGLNTLALSASGTTANLGFLPTGARCYNQNLGGGIDWGFNIGGGVNDQFCGPMPIFGETNGGAGGPDGGTARPGTGTYGFPNYNNTQYNFPFYSSIITLPYTYTGATNYMTLTGGTNVTMILQDTNEASSADPPIQTVSLNVSTAAQQGGELPFPVNPAGLPGVADTSGSDSWLQSRSYFLSLARIIATGTFVAVSATTNSVANGDLTQNDRWDEGVGRIIDPYHDVTASLVLAPRWDDPRTLAIASVPSSAFVPHPLWANQQVGQPMAHDLTCSPYFSPLPGNIPNGRLVNASYGTAPTVASESGVNITTGVSWPAIQTSCSNGIAFVSNGSPNYTGSYGDWDNGPGYMSDGPWINRPDEGGATTGAQYSGNPNFYYLPYYTGGNGSTTMGPGIFSPNREVCSPVMFGSLPTGVDPTGVNPKPWQTLLFYPGVQIGHPEAGQPVKTPAGFQPPLPPYTVIPDDLLLDLFWMPVAEPYAISEPFSTAGKVNLNYQILPFGYVTTSATNAYIRRDTGIRSALSSLKIASIPAGSSNTYKEATGGNWWGQFSTFPTYNRSADSGNLARLPIDVNQTFQQFDATFENGTIFESGAQICDMYLVPQGYSLSAFSGSPSTPGSWFGTDFSMVGTNVRDRPYADIYSRITTKSNTFTVYFTVQELKNSPSSPPNQWNEATGTVVGEYRGSKDMERYLQQSSSMPNFLTYPAPNPVLSGTASLESFYRWRIIEDNQFAP